MTNPNPKIAKKDGVFQHAIINLCFNKVVVLKTFMFSGKHVLWGSMHNGTYKLNRNPKV